MLAARFACKCPCARARFSFPDPAQDIEQGCQQGHPDQQRQQVIAGLVAVFELFLRTETSIMRQDHDGENIQINRAEQINRSRSPCATPQSHMHLFA